MKIGKDVADDRVEKALYDRACGYEQDEVKVFLPAGATEPVYAPYRARIPADVHAAWRWLNNRRPEVWRDKQEIEHSGGLTLNVTPEDASL